MLTSLPPLSLYIHIPWCLRKCPYCDFNSHATNNEQVPEQAYLNTLLTDLQNDLTLGLNLAQNRPLQSIFFGGGTPSLFSGHAINQILQGVKQQIAWQDDIEITLEANPGTFDQERFAAYLDAGINRLSIGVQSFADNSLQHLGRVHNAKQAHEAIKAATELGFPRINIDIMHGLPQQTVSMALADLQQALSYGIGHLSWYQLTLEPNTLFYKQPPILPTEDSLAEIQNAGSTLLQAQGFSQYEVSAWSLLNRPARHNLNYWTFGDYLGIGAGAHSKITRIQDSQTNTPFTIERRSKLRQPKAYMQALELVSAKNLVSEDDLALEFFMNVLRLKDGAEESLFAQRTGMDLSSVKTIFSLRNKGLLQPNRLATTNLGWRFLNDVLADFGES